MNATTRGATAGRRGKVPVVLIHCLLFAWLLLPNFALLLERPPSGWQGAGLLLMALSMASLPSLVTGHWRRFYLINIPVALVSGFTAGYTLYYHLPITIGLALSILDTNINESMELASRYFGAALLSLCGFMLYLFLALRRGSERMGHRPKFAAAALWGIMVLIYYPYLNYNLHERFNTFFNISFINNSYPFNLARTLARSWREQQAGNHVQAVLPVIKTGPVHGREIYVLVIGESVRNQSFAREFRDGDAAQRFPGLVYYDDVLTEANFTSLSVRLLLNGADPGDPKDSSPDLVLWQKAAGCYSAVISNNSTYSFNREADLSDTVGDSGVSHYTRFDHDMLPIAASLIQNPHHRRLCLILHMVGSHADYNARYDARFSKYPLDGSAIQRERAAYRNTIVALLDFLERLIAIVRREDAYAFVAYVSDHGENLMEINGLREHVTLTPTRYELKVPMLFWASRAFVDANRTRWEKLNSNRHAPISNANLLPTFLDAMGILAQADPGRRLWPSLFTDFTPAARHYITPDMALHGEQDMLR